MVADGDKGPGSAFMLIVFASYIPESVYYFFLLRWVFGNDTLKNRRNLIYGANCMITSFMILLFAWPIFFTVVLGSEGFKMTLYPSIGYVIDIALFSWWRTSIIEFYQEKVKYQNFGKIPDQYKIN